MKKIFIISFALMLIIALALSGCNQAPAETINLKLATHLPPANTSAQLYSEWAERVKTETNGQVEITIYLGESLVPMPDMVSGLEAGLTDIGEINVSAFQDQFPLTNILTLPFLPLGEPEDVYDTWIALEDEFLEMQAETEGLKVLFRAANTDFSLHTSTKLVRTPEDIKGMKTMASGALAEVMEDMNASPVNLGPGDWYTSLDRGLIEAMWMSWAAIYEMELHTLTPYHTSFPSGVSLGMGEMAMSIDTWNSLPKDVQKVFEDLSPWITEEMRNLTISQTETGYNAMEAAGQTIAVLTPEEEAVWLAAASPVHEAYLAKLAADGLPADEIYQEMLRLAGQ